MKFFFADEGNRSAIFLSHFMDSFQQVSICPNMDVAEVPLFLGDILRIAYFNN
jgi:hypothetical protein